MDGTALEALDLWKSYDGARYVLRGVGLGVRPGEVKVVWGPNGSGKTTLLNILGCLDRPTKGRVTIAGVDATGSGEARRAQIRREMVGFVFQTPRLIEELTVRENIALPLRIARRRDGDARVGKLLGELGLEDLAQRKPPELSVGQAQRVAIARALAVNPPVILADEPTASLDAEASKAVLGLLSRAAEESAAVVMASHDPLVQRLFPVGLELRDGGPVGDASALGAGGRQGQRAPGAR